MNRFVSRRMPYKCDRRKGSTGGATEPALPILPQESGGGTTSRRRASAALVLAVLAVGAAGCGSSAASKTAAPVTTATPATTSAVNVAVERSAAQSIILTAADLPGWQVSSNASSASGQSLGAKLSACAGAPSPSKVDVADVSSPNFTQGAVATQFRCHHGSKSRRRTRGPSRYRQPETVRLYP